MFDGIAEHKGRKTELPIAIFFSHEIAYFFYCFFLRSRSISRRHARRRTLNTRPTSYLKAPQVWHYNYFAHNLFIYFAHKLFIYSVL